MDSDALHNDAPDSGGPEQAFVLQLIRDFQNGHAAAFERIFEIHKDVVYSLALHFSHDSETAEEITQTVFVKLLDRLHQFRGQSKFSTWLYRIVKNTFIDHARKVKKFAQVEDESEQFEPLNATQQKDAEVSRLQQEVQHALSMLSPKLRDPLLLRYVAGLSYEEIANVLGTSAGTVASRLNRGHLKLADLLRHFKDWID